MIDQKQLWADIPRNSMGEPLSQRLGELALFLSRYQYDQRTLRVIQREIESEREVLARGRAVVWE